MVKVVVRSLLPSHADEPAVALDLAVLDPWCYVRTVRTIPVDDLYSYYGYSACA
jgi:hypothetical protein